MYENLRKRVDELFEDAPKTRRTKDLKEELLANLIEKYNDQLTTGKNEEEAINNIIDGIGDVEELVRGLKEQDVFNYEKIQKDRQKTALVLAASVGLYIMSVVVLILCSEVFQIDDTVSVCFMLTIDAMATCLIIYHFVSRPKYMKADNSMVEDFKEWKSANTTQNEIMRSIKSIVWIIIVALYFIISFIFGIWGYFWIIFVIGAAIERIITLIFELRK